MAFSIRPVTGSALREALKSRLVARAPDPDAVACAELYLAQTAELADGRPLALRRLLAR